MQRSKIRINPWLLIFSGMLMLLMVFSMVAADSTLAQGPPKTKTPPRVEFGKGGSANIQGPTLEPTSPPPGDPPTETPVPTLEPTVVPTPSGEPARPDQLPPTGGALNVEPLWLVLSVLSAASIAAGVALQRRTR
ncbi:MAG: hypothetical protein B6D41_00320 [Chloroflexi bacterium UTCFX4]|jgi:hypothetical protein|nr:MAG: hypothetical protein B6D41_00320 [Chloroflexi bacterium UTCFX4]